MSRRFEILNWAQQRGRLVIEDDYNGELRYSAKPIPALQSLSDGKRVAYLGSFFQAAAAQRQNRIFGDAGGIGLSILGKSAGYNQTASKIEQLALRGIFKREAWNASCEGSESFMLRKALCFFRR